MPAHIICIHESKVNYRENNLYFNIIISLDIYDGVFIAWYMFVSFYLILRQGLMFPKLALNLLYN